MNKDRDVILVCGATGQQGGAIARRLLSSGCRVRAMTRKPQEAKAQALAAAGAEVVDADLDDATSLERALSVARVEVSRLQERVDVAKQAKDTEAAVNLGISTKRLLSALDEAEKL